MDFVPQSLKCLDLFMFIEPSIKNVRINYLMAGVAGVEPTSAVLETVILPLNYTPKKCKQLHYNTHFP